MVNGVWCVCVFSVWFGSVRLDIIIIEHLFFLLKPSKIIFTDYTWSFSLFLLNHKLIYFFISTRLWDKFFFWSCCCFVDVHFLSKRIFGSIFRKGFYFISFSFERDMVMIIIIDDDDHDRNVVQSYSLWRYIFVNIRLYKPNWLIRWLASIFNLALFFWCYCCRHHQI